MTPYGRAFLFLAAAGVLLAACGVEEAVTEPAGADAGTGTAKEPKVTPGGIPILLDRWSAMCCELVCPRPFDAPESSYPNEYGLGCSCINDSACVAKTPLWGGHYSGCRGYPQYPQL